ncbi:SapC family protein [Gilvimarinus polysaccharolyticus]|uniref:SapC family protein n=1 Tax=Gilvimarinus polysaccharolyticus TaxID=863921 RepID=UPI0006734841|nr:SapC family protein [Gilvimarinus polysaccharolyticus]
MANPVVLDAKKHHDLRVITKRGAQFGEAVHLVPVIADELRSLVLDYPICFIKDTETGQFGLYALLGFGEGENLYLNGDNWHASYIPLHVRRQPFLVANHTLNDNSSRSVAMVDMDSARISQSADQGEAIFDDAGQPTEYFKQMQRLLAKLIEGSQITSRFIQTLADKNLLEAAKINITLASGEQKNYEGLYTINEQTLATLEPEAVSELHKLGYLQACYLMLASMGNISKLIDKKQESHE